MLPGKTYTPEDLIGVALRRKWWIVVPLVLGAIIAVVVGKRMPNQYRSETLIMPMGQRLPNSYAISTVSLTLEELLDSLNQQILSRAQLERVILDFDLYPTLRKRLPMEEVVQRMRENDLHVKLEGKGSFRLSYVGLNPRTVQQITERLAALFINENVRDRANLAEDTNQFLDSEVEDARVRLLEHEKKLEDYRRRYSGQLPSQAGANLQVIQNAQLQLQTLSESTNRDQERRLLLERQLADLQVVDQAPAVLVHVPGVENAAAGDSLHGQLENAQAKLRALQLRLKPDHPDIRVLERTIRDLKAGIEAELTPATAGAASDKPIRPAEVVLQRRAKDLRAQIDDIDRQLQAKQQQERRLRETISEHQSRLDALPMRESELVELTRDYTALQGRYAGLMQKREDSKIAVNLEKRNSGDQFKILEPARESERPIGPSRMRIDIIGAASGLFVGLLLACLLEYRDLSFRTQADVETVLKLPVLASVPVMPSLHKRA